MDQGPVKRHERPHKSQASEDFICMARMDGGALGLSMVFSGGPEGTHSSVLTLQNSAFEWLCLMGQAGDKLDSSYKYKSPRLKERQRNLGADTEL